MATQTFTPQSAPKDGGAAVAMTRNVPLTADTHKFQNDGKTILVFDKGASSCVVTMTTPGTVRGVAVADPTYTLAANTECQVIGPFSPDIFNDSDGNCSFTVSEETGLVCSVVRM